MSSNPQIKHTIFTPLYNRTDDMHLLYQKILQINYNRDNFEWLIIDDGSTDDIDSFLQFCMGGGKV